MRCRCHLLVASLVPALCVVGCDIRDDKRDAEQVLVHYFDALAHQRYDAALADYDDLFFEDVSRLEWRSALMSVVNKLGTFQRYDMSVRGSASRTTASPGTYLKFKCTVFYSKHSSEETLYLFRREGAARFKILGHEIDSPSLSSR